MCSLHYYALKNIYLCNSYIWREKKIPENFGGQVHSYEFLVPSDLSVHEALLWQGLVEHISNFWQNFPEYCGKQWQLYAFSQTWLKHLPCPEHNGAFGDCWQNCCFTVTFRRRPILHNAGPLL